MISYKYARLILWLLLLTMVCSCVTNKKITYLQATEEITDTLRFHPVAPDNYHVQVNDNLFIRVITPDPQWSAMFNTLPVQSGITATEQTVDLISYRVQQDGNIEIPFLGALQVAGLTIPEITRMVEEELSGYITDADITVKLVNNYVSLLGEVTMPGRYPIYKEHMNIFEALAMAGDLSHYSNRSNIQIIRDTENGTIIKNFDLTRRDIIHSEFYFVMPNDVIYAAPMKGRFFNMEVFPYAIVFSTITTFILIWNLINTTKPG